MAWQFHFGISNFIGELPKSNLKPYEDAHTTKRWYVWYATSDAANPFHLSRRREFMLIHFLCHNHWLHAKHAKNVSATHLTTVGGQLSGSAALCEWKILVLVVVNSSCEWKSKKAQTSLCLLVKFWKFQRGFDTFWQLSARCCCQNMTKQGI